MIIGLPDIKPPPAGVPIAWLVVLHDGSVESYVSQRQAVERAHLVGGAVFNLGVIADE